MITDKQQKLLAEITTKTNRFKWVVLKEGDSHRSIAYSLPPPASIGIKDKETGEWVFTDKDSDDGC